MQKFAIINQETNEFYADPVYTNEKEAWKKVKYLNQYRAKNNMPYKIYGVEKLSKERELQHSEEWNKFLAALD